MLDTGSTSISCKKRHENPFNLVIKTSHCDLNLQKLSFDQQFRPDPNLSSALIEQTRYLLGQFHNYYRSQELNLPESLSVESFNESEMETKVSVSFCRDLHLKIGFMSASFDLVS